MNSMSDFYCISQLHKFSFCVLFIFSPLEKLYRVQYLRGPNVFRPDLSFESVGETEAEVPIPETLYIINQWLLVELSRILG